MYSEGAEHKCKYRKFIESEMPCCGLFSRRPVFSVECLLFFSPQA